MDGKDLNTNNQQQNNPQGQVPPKNPSFGLPPETPTMPGTTSHETVPEQPVSPAKRPTPESPFPNTPPVHKTTAQDELLQSAVGKPLDGPVVPPTRKAPAPDTAFQREEKVPIPPEQSPGVESSIRDLPADSKESGQLGIMPQRIEPKSTVAPVPPQEPVAPKPETPTPPKAAVQSSISTAQPSVAQEPPKPKETPAERASRKAAIRTLESDVAETIHSKNLSVTGIALAEQKKRAQEATEDIIPEKKHFSWWAFAGIALAILGVGIVTVAYITQTKSEVPVEVTTPQDALIPLVTETELDVSGMTRADFLKTLPSLAQQNASRGGIVLTRFITFEEILVDGDEETLRRDVLPSEFFKQIISRVPDRLTRSLGDQTYFGTVAGDSGALPFLAFEVVSYDSAFAGLLEWERYLPEDLPFITYTPPAPAPTPAPVTTASSTASTTPVSSAPKQATTTVVNVTPTAPEFRDAVVQNRDVRAFSSRDDGVTRVLYAFLGQDLLVIAQNEETLTAIIDHITTARFSR